MYLSLSPLKSSCLLAVWVCKAQNSLATQITLDTDMLDQKLCWCQSSLHKGKLGLKLELMWSSLALCGWPVACFWAWILLDRQLNSSREETHFPFSVLFSTEEPWYTLGVEQPVFKWRWYWRLFLGLPSAPCQLLQPAFLVCHEIFHFQMEHS